MQTIYGPGLASNIALTAQKRLVRVAYSNTLAHPFAGVLDPAFRNTDGSLSVTPLNVAGNTRTTAPFLLNGSIVPGVVMVKGQSGGEYFNIASGDQVGTEQPFGLLGQWVGGTFDNLGQNNQIGIWQGFDSVYELIAPAWNDSGLASAITTANATGAGVLMYASRDGRLARAGLTGVGSVAVARVIDRPSAARLLIQLLI